MAGNPPVKFASASFETENDTHRLPSFLLFLTSTSVWFMRNQSLYEMWWLFTSLMRYPREIFLRDWAQPMRFFFTFIVPILLVVYVPARMMVRVFEPEWAP